MFEEFKKLAQKGIEMDMTLGVVVGASFTTILSSLVDDVLRPFWTVLTSSINFTNLFWTLKPGTPEGPYATLQAAKDAGAVTLNLGLFINSFVAFILVSLAAFVMVKLAGRLFKKKQVTAPPLSNELLLEEIKELLKK